MIFSIVYAIYCKINEKIEANIFSKVFWQFLIAIPIIYLTLGNFKLDDVVSLSSTNWMYIIILVLCCSLGAYLFLVKSIKTIGAVATGALDYLEPILVVILVVAIFSVGINPMQLIGWGLIFFALINIKKIRKKLDLNKKLLKE